MPWIRNPGFVEGSHRTRPLKLTLEVPNKASSRQVQHSIIYTLGELCRLKSAAVLPLSSGAASCPTVLELVVEVADADIPELQELLATEHPQIMIKFIEDPEATIDRVHQGQTLFTDGPRKLYIKVDKTHTEEVLKDYLRNFGPIEYLKLKRHKPSTKSRNFGYVIFKTSLAATAAFNQPSHLVKGFPIRLELPKPFESHENPTFRGSFETNSIELLAPTDSETLKATKTTALLGSDSHRLRPGVRQPWQPRVLEPHDSKVLLKNIGFSPLDFDDGFEKQKGWTQPRISRLITERHLQEADTLLTFNTLKKSRQLPEEKTTSMLLDVNFSN